MKEDGSGREEKSGKKRLENGLTRRKILSTLGGSVAALSGINVVRGNNRTVEYISEIGKDRVATRKVPQDWYEYETNRVDQALEKARSKYKTDSGIDSISLVRNPHHSIGDLNTSRLKVELREKSTSTLDQIDNVPIVRGEAEEGTLLGCEFTDNYRNWSGGVEVQAASTNGVGTSCSRVRDYVPNKWRILTAAHLFGGDNNRGERLRQPAGGQNVGPVRRFNNKEDWALVEVTNNDNMNDIIRISGSPNMHLSAFFSKNECRYKMNNPPGNSITKQGTTLGKQNGYITQIDYHVKEDVIDHHHGIRTSCNAAKGDSGGPIFGECSWGGACMVCFTSLGHADTGFRNLCNNKPIYKDTSGAAAYYLENNRNMGFY